MTTFRILYCAATVLLASLSGASATLINTIVLQDGLAPWVDAPSGAYAGTQDTHIRFDNGLADATNRNFGAANTLFARDRFVLDQPLLRYDMSSLTPYVASASVTGATLSFVNSGSTTLSTTAPLSTFNRLELFFVGSNDVSWLEGSENNAAPAPGTGATWANEIASTTSWDDNSPSTPRTPVMLDGGTNGFIASFTYSEASTNNGDTVTFTLTSGFDTLEDWLLGNGPNGGFVIVGYGRSLNTANNGVLAVWHSSESATAAFRPTLTLTGDFAVVPEPSALALIVLGFGLLARRSRSQ